MSLLLDGTLGVPVTTVTGTLPVANGGTGVATSTGSGAVVLGTSPSISGAVMSTMASSVLTSATAQATTSGTFKDFTGIPSWAKRITVMLRGISTNSTSTPQLQVGSGSVDATGYSGASSYVNNANTTTTTNLTTGVLLISTGWSSALLTSGNVVFTHMGSNIWTFSGIMGLTNATNTIFLGGDKAALSGALDRIRLTTVNGTDTFDAGSINIMYE